MKLQLSIFALSLTIFLFIVESTIAIVISISLTLLIEVVVNHMIRKLVDEALEKSISSELLEFLNESFDRTIYQNHKANSDTRSLIVRYMDL